MSSSEQKYREQRPAYGANNSSIHTYLVRAGTNKKVKQYKHTKGKTNNTRFVQNYSFSFFVGSVLDFMVLRRTHKSLGCGFIIVANIQVWGRQCIQVQAKQVGEIDL